MKFARFGFLLLILATGASGQDLATLSSQIQSGSVEEKRDALFQIRNLRSADASRLAIPALRDKNLMVRATAASSVVFLPKAEAVAVLLPLLGDREEFARREAAYALGIVGDPAASSELVRSMTSDKDHEVRSAAAAALGKLGDPSVVDALNSVLDRPPDGKTELLRRSAARSVGQIAQLMRSGKSQVLTPQNFLPEKFKDIGSRPTPEMLSHFTRAVRTLIRVLENSNESADTRREAAFALGAVGDRTAEPILTQYLASPDNYLAEICREAILKLKATE
jgi:HEAT repeat protein